MPQDDVDSASLGLLSYASVGAGGVGGPEVAALYVPGPREHPRAGA